MQLYDTSTDRTAYSLACVRVPHVTTYIQKCIHTYNICHTLPRGLPCKDAIPTWHCHVK